jgi:G/U mismatch-specific DNA glycosylase (fragment)
MTLHEAIIYVLEGYGSAMSSAEIAQEIFDKKLYLQQAGSMAPAKQIRARARKYPQLFIIEDGKIRLKASLDFTNSQKNKKSINLCQFTSSPFPKSKCKENLPSVSQEVSSNFKQGLAPWVNEKTKVLILGTMPGDISIQQQSYYFNPRNAFWKIINKLFNSTSRLEKNRSFLNNIGIGLWDVYKEGLRKGSLDTGFIGNPSINEIKDLLNQYQSIKSLVFNGQNTYKAFLKAIGKVNIPCYVFPSTSSAYSRMTFEEKLKVWTKLKELLK